MMNVKTSVRVSSWAKAETQVTSLTIEFNFSGSEILPEM